MDGLEAVKICTGYKLNGQTVQVPPVESEQYAQCEPIYETMPGWSASTARTRSFAELPENAQKYLVRVEALAGIPIDIISTGSDRNDTIMLRNPFEEDVFAEERIWTSTGKPPQASETCVSTNSTTPAIEPEL